MMISRSQMIWKEKKQINWISWRDAWFWRYVIKMFLCYFNILSVYIYKNLSFNAGVVCTDHFNMIWPGSIDKLFVLPVKRFRVHRRHIYTSATCPLKQETMIDGVRCWPACHVISRPSLCWPLRQMANLDAVLFAKWCAINMGKMVQPATKKYSIGVCRNIDMSILFILKKYYAYKIYK